MKAYLCILHIITHSILPPQTLTLIQRNTTTTYPFPDSTTTITITATLDRPLIATLLLSYPNKKAQHLVLLSPGELYIQVNEDNEIYIDGPPLSHDFTALLEQPMIMLSRRVEQLKNQLEKNNGDIQTIKDELAEAVRRREAIPRAYFDANPGLPLSQEEIKQILNKQF